MSINVPDSIYNPNSPDNLTLVKNIPLEIRKKGQELINLIETIENNRITSDMDATTAMFPFMNTAFIVGNSKIPAGVYMKANNCWFGYSNFTGIPNSTSGVLEGQRVTINNRSYEFVVDGETKVWAERNDFKPILFYNFLEISRDNNYFTLSNKGTGSETLKLNVENVLKPKASHIPGVTTRENSTMRTSDAYTVVTNFTYSATFYKISREYLDGTEKVINPDSVSVLLFVRDEFENVKIGVGINKDYKVCFLNNENITETDTILDSESIYQISIKSLGGKISICINGVTVYETAISAILNKRLMFSICDDNTYGRYANGAAIVGEMHMFKEVLSPQEEIWLRDYPRTWSLNKRDSYLDLTIEEKIKLKNLILGL